MAKRSERLLGLMQALRRRRRPVAGQVLADELGVSLRSLYRDIATLRGMGAAIDGEAGVGFQLNAELFLPPLMFSEGEVEALVLGLRTLIYGPDAELAGFARDASAKIGAVLPKGRAEAMDGIGLFALPQPGGPGISAALRAARRAMREERQALLRYTSIEEVASERVVYPVALGYFEGHQALVAWCTLRSDFRRFRIDRVDTLEVLGERLPEPRRTLLHRWRMRHGLPDLT